MSKDAAQNWFADGVQFECTMCGKCCQVPQAALAVNGMAELSYPGPAISDGEVSLLAAHLKLSEEECRRQYVAFCRQGYQALVVKDGACQFYDRETKLCRVHEARPSYCRSFPFTPHAMAAKMFWDSAKHSCEGINQGELISESDILQKLNGRAQFVYCDGAAQREHTETVEDETVDPRYADD